MAGFLTTSYMQDLGRSCPVEKIFGVPVTSEQSANFKEMDKRADELVRLRRGSKLIVPNKEGKFLTILVKFTSLTSGNKFEMSWAVPPTGRAIGFVWKINGHSPEPGLCNPFQLSGPDVCR